MSHSTTISSPTPSSRPYRIALCITELDVGGAEQQFVRLASGLDRTVFEPHVYCLAPEGPLVEPLRKANVPVTCLDVRSRRDFGVVRRLADELRQFQPDLLQTFLFHANIAGRLAARRAGVRHVVSGIRVAEPRRWHLWIDRLTERFVDRHVCVSESVAQYSRDAAGLDPRKIVVIPNGIDAERFASAVPTTWPFQAAGEHAPPVILFVGRLEPQKNPELLIDAFRLLAPTHQDVHLVFAGSGSLANSLQHRSAVSPSSPRVHFLGQRDDIPRLMKAATCLALPSRWEGMPNVVLEAMAAGLPVVACAAEGVRELLADGKHGEIASEPTPVALAESLKRLLDNRPQSRQKSLLSQVIVNKRFTISAMVKWYQKVYLDLIKSSPSSTKIPQKSPPQPPDEKNWENLQSQPG